MTPCLPPANTGAERVVIVETFDWRGIAISVSYEPDWLGRGTRGALYPVAHLQISSRAPEKAPLPITETGYRSHFLAQGLVEERGGPTAFARAWLDEAARQTKWSQLEFKSRQLDLFG
jgi:hypothetical protein